MRVAVIDVGSNTVRLLVAAPSERGLEVVTSDRVTLGLGASIERSGTIPPEKLAEAETCARRLARRARESGADLVEVLVTSPGRQASNGEALVAAVARAADAAARQLSGEDEGRLAYEGALAAEGPDGSRVAVCDVGGGSTQLAIGSGAEPDWVKTFDVGSLRLTKRSLDGGRTGRKALAAAGAVVAEAFAEAAPPAVDAGLAVGGSARALRRLEGRTLDEESLASAIKELTRRTPAETAKRFGVDKARAETLLAGALILSEVQRRLAVPLRVARGGLREGAALRLLRYALAA